jgi:uncharacterized surface protein with fasciclin (FAS1) repeats
MRRQLCAALAIFAALAFTLSACSSNSKKSSSSGGGGTSASTAGSAPSSSSAMGAEAQFGAACAMVPSDPSNPGSFDAMAKQPVATAASGNPLLSTLVSAVKAAGLVDTLNSASNITVFAPDNAAFAKIPAATLKKVLANKALLTKILTYHVIGQRLSPAQVTGSLTSLEKGAVKADGSAPDITVGPTGTEAKVVCGNVQTANATVYIVDTVMMPKS